MIESSSSTDKQSDKYASYPIFPFWALESLHGLTSMSLPVYEFSGRLGTIIKILLQYQKLSNDVIIIYCMQTEKATFTVALWIAYHFTDQTNQESKRWRDKLFALRKKKIHWANRNLLFSYGFLDIEI